MSEDRLVDPGVARFGNFPNYYQFNSVENRITFISADLTKHLDGDKTVLGLDIGCNSGNMTVALYEHLCRWRNAEKKGDVRILAVDIDPNLVDSCKENNPFPDAITFQVLDVMDDDKRHETLCAFLELYKAQEISITFCLSVTMWIHLNHGDEGLWKFLTAISEKSKCLVIEPQPWKCYSSAARRMRRFQQKEFPFYQQLKVRHDVDKKIDEYLRTSCKMDQVQVFGSTSWNRRLILYKRSLQ